MNTTFIVKNQNINASDTLYSRYDIRGLVEELLEARCCHKRYLYENYRVVYGGRYTILLNKRTKERVCMVTRERGVKNNLYKAVLYLVARSRGVYGTEIQSYIDNGSTTYFGLLEYLLEFGYHRHYTKEELSRYDKIVHNEQDLEVGFLYVLLIDRFGYTKEELDKLVEEAVCSETTKTQLRMAKRIKKKTPSKTSTKTRHTKTREDLEKL